MPVIGTLGALSTRSLSRVGSYGFPVVLDYEANNYNLTLRQEALNRSTWNGTVTVGILARIAPGVTIGNVASPLASVSTQYTLVGGGGGGAATTGGGGGGGGLLSGTTTLNANTTYAIVIGNGGAIGANGTNTTFNSLNAIAGGAGGSLNAAGLAGGSGGGGG